MWSSAKSTMSIARIICAIIQVSFHTVSVNLAPTIGTAETQKSRDLKKEASMTAKTCGMLPVMIKRKTQVALICRNPGLRQKPDISDSNTGMLYQSSQAKAN